jgi:transcriptional regulator with XRE-family HTH domain
VRNDLIKLRTDRGLTQKELADALSVAEITIRKIEAADRNPSPEMAKKFAIFYGMKLDELFPEIFLVEFDTKRSDCISI